MREPRAYNQSIYLMVGMPYLLLGSVGILIYRAHRKKANGPFPQMPPELETVSKRGQDL